jgi:uncharacterized protein (TIGR02466 family)
MMQLCFPTIYWHFSVGHIDLEDLEDQCVLNKEWNCNVRTSRGVEYDWNEFLKTIQPYFTQLPYKKESTIDFAEPWMNVYSKGCYQESHQHMSGGHQLSYCYFSKLPKGSGKFGFWNEQFRMYCSNQLQEVMNLDIVEWGFPEVKEGDLLIFPSFLTHQVTYHPIDELRVTVSGNVSLIV